MFNLHLFNRIVYNRSAGRHYRFHPILEAEYFTGSPEVNRAFVAGQDAAGALVSGSAITQADVDLVGERLEVQHDSAVPSAAVAAAVAQAVLDKARLDGSKGRITIPPHCGMELWDVVSITDTAANQSTSYRVTGYTLEYGTIAGNYRHTMMLGSL